MGLDYCFDGIGWVVLEGARGCSLPNAAGIPNHLKILKKVIIDTGSIPDKSCSFICTAAFLILLLNSFATPSLYWENVL